MKSYLAILLPPILVLSCSKAFASSAAELEQLREMLADQQTLITRLLENQQHQAIELAALKKELHAVPEETQPVPQNHQSSPTAALPKRSFVPDGAVVSMGGHLNRAITVADDGNSTEAYFVDNGNIPTYAYVKASKQVSDHLTLGGRIEYGLAQNSALSVSQDNEDAGLNVSSRFFEMTLASSRYGKLSLGRGFMSSFSSRLKALDRPTNHSTVIKIRSHKGMKTSSTVTPDLSNTKTATT